MSTDDPWTADERERIRAFNNSEDKDAQILAGTTLRGGARENADVGVETCSQWRDVLRENERLTAKDHSPETAYSLSSLRQHAFGHCNHDESEVGEPADANARRGGWH